MMPVAHHCLPSGMGQERGERAFVYVRERMCDSREKVMSVKKCGGDCHVNILGDESKDKKSQHTEKRDMQRLKAINRHRPTELQHQIQYRPHYKPNRLNFPLIKAAGH